MHLAVAPGPSGADWPVRRQNASIRAGMSPGAANESSSGSTSERSAGAAAAAAISSSNE
jgi:hypothetical protein